MKKSINTLVAAALAASMVMSMTGCSGKTAESSASESSEVSCAASTAESVAASEGSTAAPTISGADEEKGEGVMTYAEYSAAELDSQVTVETYIQAKQGWWENEGVGVATFYTQDADGAYFLYNMPCSEDEYALLTEGTKIKVTGYKSEWSGEIEITDATYEIEDGNYIAEPVDVTDLLASDDLINSQNMLVSFTGMTVEAADDSGAAFLYNYDGSGSEGDDLYFKVSYNGQTYTFTVESYLTGSDSDVYKAVKALKVGQKVDMEGFLYWYEGVNPHIISVTAE
ncbi:MAG: hypothetical protein LKG26_03140 [Saccharofermentans sp.]|jgi:hypothetical protein|nr:hypothetical protein [Mageeibacillus sp.]MCI1263818.1 hypothetical protein [Saccharofermentans sp.]MCI1275068.1 hypothetical protein [Saccharofermentans sp.]MCI1769139.1 hypothetical protein [Mageeibacillus sp.]MCI2044311.1 hypothetical protein [Mageeibacillus sp.]